MRLAVGYKPLKIYANVSGCRTLFVFLLDLWAVGLVVAEGFAGAGGEVVVQAGII